MVLQKRVSSGTMTVVVPTHPELARGTLRSVIRKAGLTPEEFRGLL